MFWDKYSVFGSRDCVVIAYCVEGGNQRGWYKTVNKYLNNLNQGTYTATNFNGFPSHESAEVSDRQQNNEVTYLYCSLKSIHLSCFANEMSKSLLCNVSRV